MPDRTLTEIVDRALGPLAGKALAEVDEVAEVLGLGRTATFDAIRRGDLPSVRWGRRLFVPVPALARWLLDVDDPAVSDGAVADLAVVAACEGEGRA